MEITPKYQIRIQDDDGETSEAAYYVDVDQVKASIMYYQIGHGRSKKAALRMAARNLRKLAAECDRKIEKE